MILGYLCLVCGYICDAVTILLYAYLMIKPKESKALPRVDVVLDFESRSNNVTQNLKAGLVQVKNLEARTAEINRLMAKPLIDIDRIKDIVFETDEDLLFKRYKENEE